jgi:hypothetical protein
MNPISNYPPARRLSRLFLSVLAGAGSCLAQFNADDPFAGNYRMAASDEVLVAVADSQSGELKLRLLDVDPAGSVGRDYQLLASLSLPGMKIAQGTAVEREAPAVDLAMLDLDGDGHDDMLVFFEGADRQPILQRPRYDAATGEFSAGDRYMLSDHGFPLLYQEKSNRTFTEMRVVAAQLDSDPESEFLLAYWGGDDGEVRVIAAEIDASGDLVVLGTIADVSMQSDIDFDSSAASDSARFDIAAGSLDADYGDEIILAYVWQDFAKASGVYRKVFARVYDFVPGEEESIRFRTEIEEPDWSGTSRTFDQVFRLAVAAGDFNNDGLDEIAMASSIGSRSGGVTNNFDIGFYTLNPEMTGLVALQQRPHFIESTLSNTLYPLDLAVGDYNYDNVDDIGWLGRQGARILTRWRDGAPIEGKPSSIGFSATNGNSDYVNIASGIAVTDLDADTDADLQGEVVSIAAVENSSTREWEVRVGNWKELFPPDNDPPSVALVSGDLDADSLQLGKPRIYRRTDLGQPVMILNAPPTHFDILNGVVFDVNNCLSGDCGTYASYTLQNELIQEVSTEVRADWAISAGVSVEVEGGVSVPFVKAKARVKASLDGKYGQGFSRVRNAGRTIRETREFVARGDDLIYASVADYDILEYPVYRAGEFLGTIASVVPKNPRMVIFNSKSPRAADYVTPHEPGNILSYRPQVKMGDNPLVTRPVSSFTGFSWEMQPQGTSSWTLELSQYAQNQLTQSTEMSISARVEVERSVEAEVPLAKFVTGSLGVTVGGYIQGDYSKSRISTHKTTVSVDHTVLVNFGNVDTGILGDTTYEVTPYLYWGRNGALVLDYAVDPVLGDGYEGWWQQQYGHAPDLAFTLPWRHDIARGSNISADQAQRTRNIVVNPARPRAGDTVDIYARVHNYSLDPDGSPPASLRFFLDNRDGRGLVPMANSAGRTELTVPGLAPRASLILGLSGWKVPWVVNPNARVYAIIDQDNLVAEIHEDNNTGWALLNASGGNVWPDASVFEDNWIRSPWLGWMNQRDFPRVLHANMGDIHVPEGTQPESFFYYDYAFGKWFWTAPSVWPYVLQYRNGGSRWLYYYQDTATPNRFYHDPATGSILQEAGL